MSDARVCMTCTVGVCVCVCVCVVKKHAKQSNQLNLKVTFEAQILCSTFWIIQLWLLAALFFLFEDEKFN